MSINPGDKTIEVEELEGNTWSPARITFNGMGGAYIPVLSSDHPEYGKIYKPISIIPKFEFEWFFHFGPGGMGYDPKRIVTIIKG